MADHHVIGNIFEQFMGNGFSVFSEFLNVFSGTDIVMYCGCNLLQYIDYGRTPFCDIIIQQNIVIVSYCDLLASPDYMLFTTNSTANLKSSATFFT